jgi:hypothetical protein
MGVGGQGNTPAALPPGKRPGTHCIGGWVGPRAGLDGWRKISPPPEFDPRTFQPIASHYADYAIPAPCPCVDMTVYVVVDNCILQSHVFLFNQRT